MDAVQDFIISLWDINLLLVFILNLCATCLSTLKTIFLSRNIVKPVYITTFIDSIIFVYTVTLVTKASSFVFVIAFALGRIAGIYLGKVIESKLAIGTIEVVVFKHLHSGKALAEKLRACGFSTSAQIGIGIDGQENLILTIVTDRRNFPLLMKVIRESDSNINMYITRIEAVKGGMGKRSRVYSPTEDTIGPL